MPRAAPKACRCGGTIRESICDRCGPVTTSQPQKRKSARARGYDRTWERLSKEFLQLHPWCHDCEQRGIDQESEEVHHIEPIAAAPHKRLDPSNLMALCHSCHSVRTQQESNNSQAGSRCIVVQFTDRDRAIAHIRTKRGREDLVFDFDAIASTLGFSSFPRPIDVAQLVVSWRRDLIKRIKSDQIKRRVWIMASEPSQAKAIASDLKGLVVSL